MSPVAHEFRGPDESWAERARCRRASIDPDSFYAEPEFNSKVSSPKLRKAVACCMRCEVRPECLRHAVLNTERWGVWGGLTQGKRRLVINAVQRHPLLFDDIITQALSTSEAQARKEGLA